MTPRIATLLAATPLLAACPLESASLGDGGSDGIDGGDEPATTATDTDGGVESSTGVVGTDDGDEPSTGTTSDGSSDESAGEDAPAPTLLWSSHIEGVDGTHMALASDGSFVIVGYDGYLGNGEFEPGAELWLGRLAPEGELGPVTVQWTTTIPHDNWRFAPRDMAPLSDGGFVLLVEDFEDGGADGVTRYDANGEPVWFVPVENVPLALDVGPDDSMVVGANVINEVFGTSTGIAVAIAADGTILWSRPYPGSGSTSVADVRIGADGDVYMIRRSELDHLCLHRAASDGTPKWDYGLDGGGDFDHMNALRVAPDGTAVALLSLLATGQTVVAVDGDGNALWTTTPFADTSTRLALGSDGSFVAVDSMQGSPAHLRMARHEAGGAIRWQFIDDTCSSGGAVELTADDHTLVLAQCGADSALQLYADP